MPKELATQVEKEEIRICANCGAFLAPQAEKCGICGQAVVEEVAEEKGIEEILAAEVKESKGISKDFLARWQRVAEKTPTREEQLQEELKHYDELLDVDPKLERAWVLKSHVLRELGRSKEAAQCLDKAASINPQREEEYRLQVLNLAETLADSSVIPPRWSKSAPSDKPEAETSAILKALSHYERLLRANPRLDVAWETRAELLLRLGRTEEAESSRARASDTRRMKMEGERRALEGLRTGGVPIGKGVPKAGRVNGLVNGIGRTNGLVNGIGRTNGLVNGLGRTNGLVNGLGRTNGLVNGIGRTNGLVNGLGRVNGLVNGIGHVNGLVNGNGFTNGRRGRYRPSFRPERVWFGSAGAIAAIVTILLTAPMIAMLLSQGPQVTAMRVDGDFSDWSGIRSYQDPTGDTKGANQSYRSDLDIVSTKIAPQNGQLALYAKVNGTFFDTPGGSAQFDAVDYLTAMIDLDDRPATGYAVGGIGADAMVMISGYDGNIKMRRLMDWKPELGGGHDNFSAFRQRSEISAAASGDEIEFMIPVYDAEDVRVLMMTANTTGVIDSAGAVMQAARSTLIVSQTMAASDIVMQTQAAILGVQLNAKT